MFSEIVIQNHRDFHQLKLQLQQHRNIRHIHLSLNPLTSTNLSLFNASLVTLSTSLTSLTLSNINLEMGVESLIAQFIDNLSNLDCLESLTFKNVTTSTVFGGQKEVEIPFSRLVRRLPRLHSLHISVSKSDTVTKLLREMVQSQSRMWNLLYLPDINLSQECVGYIARLVSRHALVNLCFTGVQPDVDMSCLIKAVTSSMALKSLVMPVCNRHYTFVRNMIRRCHSLKVLHLIQLKASEPTDMVIGDGLLEAVDGNVKIIEYAFHGFPENASISAAEINSRTTLMYPFTSLMGNPEMPLSTYRLLRSREWMKKWDIMAFKYIRVGRMLSLFSNRIPYEVREMILVREICPVFAKSPMTPMLASAILDRRSIGSLVTKEPFTYSILLDFSHQQFVSRFWPTYF